MSDKHTHRHMFYIIICVCNCVINYSLFYIIISLLIFFLLFANKSSVFDWCHSIWWSLLALTWPCCFASSLHFLGSCNMISYINDLYLEFSVCWWSLPLCWIVLCPKVTPVPLRPWERASRRFQWTRKAQFRRFVSGDQVLERNRNSTK